MEIWLTPLFSPFWFTTNWTSLNEKKKKKSNSAHHTVTLVRPTHMCTGREQTAELELGCGSEVALGGRRWRRWCWGGGGGWGGAEVVEVAEVALRWRRWRWGGRGGAGMREVAEVARRWWMGPWGSGSHVALRKWRWRWVGSAASGSGTAWPSWWRRRSALEPLVASSAECANSLFWISLIFCLC